MGDNIKEAARRPPAVEFGIATQALGMDGFFVSTYGDIDLVTAPELETELLDAAHSGARQVVVDLTEATFFDSSGVHALMRAGERLHSTGLQFAIVCGNHVIKRILEITGVDQIFPVHATIENAIGPIGAPEPSPGGVYA